MTATRTAARKTNTTKIGTKTLKVGAHVRFLGGDKQLHFGHVVKLYEDCATIVDTVLPQDWDSQTSSGVCPVWVIYVSYITEIIG